MKRIRYCYPRGGASAPPLLNPQEIVITYRKSLESSTNRRRRRELRAIALEALAFENEHKPSKHPVTGIVRHWTAAVILHDFRGPRDAWDTDPFEHITVIALQENKYSRKLRIGRNNRVYDPRSLPDYTSRPPSLKQMAKSSMAQSMLASPPQSHWPTLQHGQPNTQPQVQQLQDWQPYRPPEPQLMQPLQSHWPAFQHGRPNTGPVPQTYQQVQHGQLYRPIGPQHMQPLQNTQAYPSLWHGPHVQHVQYGTSDQFPGTSQTPSSFTFERIAQLPPPPLRGPPQFSRPPRIFQRKDPSPSGS